MEFGNFIEQFAEISGVEMPEIVDDAAAFDADGMPFFLMRVANEGESEHVVNFTGEDPITIHQPSNTGDSRYELQVDDKKKTATLTLTTDYAIKCSQNLGDNVFYDNQNTSGIKFGSVSYTYQFTITGLGTGHPQLSSADFGQTITARDM